MKFAVGYQLAEENEETFADIVERYCGSLSEVYFPWLDNATGRGSLAGREGYFDWSAQAALVKDLKKFKMLGLRLDLLYNGNCYGDEAVSVKLSNRISSVLDYLQEEGCPADIVTTTSPAIAHMVKTSHPGVEIRASVNMRIGTVKGMQYLAELFDSFYIQRDYNRDFSRIAELKEWADANGKKLCLLANSGCMRFCSGQTFHDNMVAHGNGIESQKNIEDFMPYACWQFLKDKQNWVSLLQNTWVRPEDTAHYEPYFDTVKLATRMHRLPGLVIDSYTRGRYYGNLLDLFEPGYGPALAPYVVDNARFPEDWFERTSSCGGKCTQCGYCAEVLERVLVNSERE